MSINANYAGAMAFSVALEMDKKWSVLWTNAWPFYSMIKGMSGHFNDNTRRDTTGTKMILPVTMTGPTTSARKATNSNQNTPITPTTTTGFSQFEYYYATYENTTYLNIQEDSQLVGKTNMMAVLPGKVDQIMDDFITVIDVDMVGTQNGTGRDGTGAVTGEQYFLSASNSPGNVSQTSFPRWAAQINSVGGPMSESLITTQMDAINDRGKGRPDFLQLSYAASNNVYGKFMAMVSSAQILINEEDEVKFGFLSCIYKGMRAWQDGRLGDSLPGSMVIGSANSWWLNQDSDKPIPARRDAIIRLPGTSSYEFFYSYTLSVGNNDLGRNALVTNVA